VGTVGELFISYIDIWGLPTLLSLLVGFDKNGNLLKCKFFDLVGIDGEL